MTVLTYEHTSSYEAAGFPSLLAIVPGTLVLRLVPWVWPLLILLDRAVTA